MQWTFEKVAGPFQGAMGGVLWTGSQLLFSAVDEACIKQYDPCTGTTSSFRSYTARVNGLAVHPDGRLFACQEGARRIIQYLPDGTCETTGFKLDGKFHNYPNDIAIDSAARIWFTDPHSTVLAFGPQLFPPLEHQSVLRLHLNDRHLWVMERMTFDTVSPRALLLSADEKTLYVADGDAKRRTARELRAYPVLADGSLGVHRVLYACGADVRGLHRGIEGLALDAQGNVVACMGSGESGPGPSICVFSPEGRLLETHAFPGGAPVRCGFGDAGLHSLYVTAEDGGLYRAAGIPRKGIAPRPLAVRAETAA
jgi:gluconolactonase